MSLESIASENANTPSAANGEDSGWMPFFKLLVFLTGALLCWGVLALPLIAIAGAI